MPHGAGVPLPFAVDFMQLESIITAAARGASCARVARLTDLGEPAIISNLPFLKALGIVTADSSRSKIKLSRTGAKYAAAISKGDKAVQRELLSGCVQKALRPAIRFCELQKNPEFEKLFFQLKFLAGVQDTWEEHMDTAAPSRAGICTAIEMMVFAGIVDECYMPKSGSATNAVRSVSDST